MKLTWEPVEQTGLSTDVRILRARVGSGWLYRLAVAMAFVPDPEGTHEPAELRELIRKALLMNDIATDPELIDDLVKAATGKDPASEDH